MRDNYTEIIFILDRSGSMQSIKPAIISGFNEFLQGQQMTPGEASISLYQFDKVYSDLKTDRMIEPVYEAKPLNDAPKLTNETFLPRGRTPLYDAIGSIIESVGTRLNTTPEDQKPSKVLIVTLTDGEENASTVYSQAKVKEMIIHQHDAYKWEFMFIGANQDAVLNAVDLGISRDMAITFAAMPENVLSTYKSVGNLVTRYRGGAIGQSLCFTPSDRKDAVSN